MSITRVNGLPSGGRGGVDVGRAVLERKDDGGKKEENEEMKEGQNALVLVTRLLVVTGSICCWKLALSAAEH